MSCVKVQKSSLLEINLKSKAWSYQQKLREETFKIINFPSTKSIASCEIL